MIKTGTVILSAAKNLPRHTEILSAVKNDRPLPILIRNVHQWHYKQTGYHIFAELWPSFLVWHNGWTRLC